MKLFQRLRLLWRWLFTKEPVPRKLTIPIPPSTAMERHAAWPAGGAGGGLTSVCPFTGAATLVQPSLPPNAKRAQQSNRYPDSHDGEDASSAEESPS